MTAAWRPLTLVCPVFDRRIALRISWAPSCGETRAIAEVSLEDRRQDLLGYLASNALAEARAKIGIGLRGNSGRSAPPISVRPPA